MILTFLVFVLLFFNACTLIDTVKEKPEPNLMLQPVAFSDLPGWSDGTQAGVLPALRHSCARLTLLPTSRLLHKTVNAGHIGIWEKICNDIRKLPIGNHHVVRAFLETRFQPFLATNNGEEEGLFTGYYEAELTGARQSSSRYTVPIFSRPEELVTVNLGQFNESMQGKRIAGQVHNGRLIPYFSRSEIENGALARRNLELAWVDDPVDAFFLHIQGSGRIRLNDGSFLRVGYAAHNGYSYVSIGKLLIERNEIPRDEISMQTIRAWLYENRKKSVSLMRDNPSYVFFHELIGDGPIGSQGAVLTPERSLAVDRRFIPMGVPLWLDTTHPLAKNEPLRLLVVAQDTGGAIKGPVRGDLFWGFGDVAAQKAGYMKQQGTYYLLLPKL